MSEPRSARIELSAGGVICRVTNGEVEVLLIKDSYFNWGFPKGHVEPGESLEEAAIRECREETGLEHLDVAGSIATTDWYFRVGGTLVHKYCDYFLLMAGPREEAVPQIAEGIRECVWMSPGEALGLVTYHNARQVLARALESPRLAAAAATGNPSRERRARGK